MKTISSCTNITRTLALGPVLSLTIPVLAQADPLPSWNHGAAKQAIIAFVETTTTPTSADFVPPAIERPPTI